jgi:hypothetical protein
MTPVLPPAYSSEKTREDELNAESVPVDRTAVDNPSASPSGASPPLLPASAGASSKDKSTIFSKLKGKSKANLTLAEREAKRENEAKAYYAQREVMLAKRKEESTDAEFARLLTRPYTVPLLSDYGGPTYKPPVHKSFGQKVSDAAGGALNLLFGS